MSVLVLLNNFMHDFSAAGWLFGSVLLSACLRILAPEIASGAIQSVLRVTLLLMRISLGGIVVFGAFRAIAYEQYEWNAVAGQDQVTLLVVKHVILTFVFFWGLVWYLRARRLIRNAPID